MKTKTIQALKEKLRKNLLTDSHIDLLRNDSRKGVQRIVEQFERKKHRDLQLKQLYEKMSLYEKQLDEKGFSLIAGVDEAGRGPLAGPVTAAAVILDRRIPIYGLNDSKKLTIKKRQSLFKEIKKKCLYYHIEFINNEVIDAKNILEATRKAMYSAIEGLNIKPDHVLIDAVQLKQLPVDQTVLFSGDTKSISIAAASILAKEARDRYMNLLHEQYPQYGFNKNKGYGTKEHIKALQKHGPSPYHRMSFAPVTQAVEKNYL